MRVTGGVMRMPGVGVRFGRAVISWRVRFGRALLFEFIESLFVGVVLLREFGFVEVIRWIVIAEIGVFEDIFFGLESCVAGIEGVAIGSCICVAVFGGVAGIGRCLFGVFLF